MAIRSRDDGVGAAPEDGRVEEAKQPVALCAEVDKGMVERVYKDLWTGPKVAYAILTMTGSTNIILAFSAVDPSVSGGRTGSRSSNRTEQLASTLTREFGRMRCVVRFRASSTTTFWSRLIPLPDVDPSQLRGFTHESLIAWVKLPEGRHVSWPVGTCNARALITFTLLVQHRCRPSYG